MNILVIAAEVAPLAKVGGLADVVGALPKALKARGHDVRIAVPCYSMIADDPKYAVEDVTPPFPIKIHDALIQEAFIKRTYLPGTDSARSKPAESERIPVYLVGNPKPNRSERSTPISNAGYFQNAAQSSQLYVYAPEPYVFFCRAVIEMLDRIDPFWKPDVLHCNDWHTGLIPVYARTFYSDWDPVRNAATVTTIHNLAYQGDFKREEWTKTGLPDTLFTIEGLEFFGSWSFLKGGLQFADFVNTVSENYACEIQSREYGAHLDGLLREIHAQGRLAGILNGIDCDVFDPAHDPHIPVHFSAADPSGKAKCKAALQQELKLPRRKHAVVGMISRLADQKGVDLITEIGENLLELPIQLVILGMGDPAYERYFTQLQARYPKQVHAHIGFDTDLAQRIYAGSDLFLMPSRFEPCGLGQMISLRYGTIPIVRATGGLADTILDFDPEHSPSGNGFVFAECRGGQLLAAIERALAVYGTPRIWKTLVKRALSSDFAWEKSAHKYEALYTAALNVRRNDLSRGSKAA